MTGRYHSISPSLDRFARRALGGRERAARSAMRRLDRRSLRPARDQAVDVVEAHAEYDAVDDHEKDERYEHARGGDRRDRVGGAQDAVRDPGLAPDLRGDPAAQHRDEAEPPPVSYTHLRAHETPEHLVCRLLL